LDNQHFSLILLKMDDIIKIEAELDEKLKHLKIWELPFQTILSWLLLSIDSVGRSKGLDTAIDYCSRLSYIYNIVKQNAAKAEINSSTNAILSFDPKYIPDINFLIAYAHFSLLMPQIRRNVMKPVSNSGKVVELDFVSEATENAELIDRLYSYISLQAMVTYPKEEALKAFLLKKATSINTKLEGEDTWWINDMYQFFKQYMITVEVLPSKVLEDVLGFTFDDYLSFKATIRAFGEYHYNLGDAYFSLSQAEKGNPQRADTQMSEYFENLVNCFDFKFVGFYVQISGLSKEKVLKIMSYYLSTYSNKTGENFVERSFCGEGFYPPFTLFDTFIISSPHAVRYMLTMNNILYSVNKKDTKTFDQKLSSHLEPTLVNQLGYLFTSLKGVQIMKNVNYPGSEIDLLVFSPSENICLVIQVKATIAPDSSRTVDRVQDRAIEGIQQINHFRGLTSEVKQEIINSSFNVKQTNTLLIDLLALRSCAGTELIWRHNDEIKITNYTFLAWIISEKIKNNDFALAHFENIIKNYQEDLIRLSDSSKVYETLVIDDYSIKFPNINTHLSEVIAINFRTYKYLEKFEKSHS
jgi:hypothetical protein